MKKILLLTIGVLYSQAFFAQFQVGHTTLTFNDAGRTGGFGSGGGAGRQIQTEVYYPAGQAGDNVALSTGNFPVIVFGHGFAMAWSAYENIWTRMAQEGYIIAFPRTESGLFPSPSHSDFGKDLALVVNKMLALNSSSGSLFLNKINGNAAIMGHSMGGGATFLAGAHNTSIKTVVGLAPAQTDPLASDSAAFITVPALILSGTSDGVTPAADHHTLIYNALASNCKYFLNLIGGGHCYFANTNTNCDFGESTSSNGITLTRAEQQTIMFDYILPWFAYYLKEDCQAWGQFINPQATDTRITPLSTCSVTVPQTPVITMGTNVLTSSVTSNIQWYKDGVILTGQTSANLPLTFGSGSYTVVYSTGGSCVLTSAPYVYTVATNGIDVLQSVTAIFPNPTTNSFQITISNGLPFSAKVMTVEGKIVQQIEATENVQIESSTWNSGIYLVEISQGTTKITRRVVKK